MRGCGKTRTRAHVEARSVQRTRNLVTAQAPRSERLARVTTLAVHGVELAFDVADQHIHTVDFETYQLTFIEIRYGDRRRRHYFIQVIGLRCM